MAESIIWKDFLQINLKIRSSDVFKDKEPAEDEELEEEELEALKFKWHCEAGIVANS